MTRLNAKGREALYPAQERRRCGRTLRSGTNGQYSFYKSVLIAKHFVTLNPSVLRNVCEKDLWIMEQLQLLVRVLATGSGQLLKASVLGRSCPVLCGVSHSVYVVPLCAQIAVVDQLEELARHKRQQGQRQNDTPVGGSQGDRMKERIQKRQVDHGQCEPDRKQD